MSEGQSSLPSLGQLPRMVVWYGPTALYRTGMRQIISGVFGQYADQRILQWVTDQVPAKDLASRYDYSAWAQPGDGNAVWVDYVADAGDGFDSAYSIASLIGAPSLDIEGAGKLEGGKLLVMGGDQVYPYPSADQYEEHLITPYKLANTDFETDGTTRKLFVLPGNHDWYDGLGSFDQTFCQARDGASKGLDVGQWHCPQHRSYFAIKLPHDWWIWGLDTQLTRNLDVGQMRYFETVAQNMAEPSKAKIILCISQPAWMEAAATGSEKSFPGNTNRLVSMAFKEAKVCTIITGDTHHYNRYRGTENGLNLITAGGGGAYLSPTHDTPDTIKVPWNKELHEFSLRQKTEGGPGAKPGMTEPSLFPSRATSRALSWWLLLFPFHNRAFSFGGLGIIYWLLTWALLNTPVNGGNYGGSGRAYVYDIFRNPGAYPNVGGGVWLIMEAAISSILLAFFGLLILATLYTYVRSNRHFVRLIASFLHWSAHIAAMMFLAMTLTRFNARLDELWRASAWQNTFSFDPSTITGFFFYPVEMIVLGGAAGGVIWGLYLFINCRIFRLHMDDAFSALSLPHYKHFLRMKIEPDQLTIYPIGLKRVPHRLMWRERTAEEKAKGVRTAFVPRMGLKPHLIEGPIVIRPSDVRSI
jgi:hypothetical protein